MMSFSKQHAGWFLLPLILVAAHATWVISAISADKKNVEKARSVESFELSDREREPLDSEMKAFSLLMGVDPVMGKEEIVLEVKDIRYITLRELDPKLLAVDEVSGTYTARIWLDNGKLQASKKQNVTDTDTGIQAAIQKEFQTPEINPSLKLYSVAEGDILFHYRVKELGLSHVRLAFDPVVEHDWTDVQDELILRLFNREEASISASQQ